MDASGGWDALSKRAPQQGRFPVRTITAYSRIPWQYQTAIGGHQVTAASRFVESRLGTAPVPPMDKLLSRLKETERRYRDRRDPRKKATERLRKKDFIGANSDEELRARLSHLDVAPELTESVGTRSFRMPQRPVESSTRALIDNVTLERILASNDLMPISYLALGLQKARSVGRIHVKDTMGRRLGFGTGFLVSPALLLTNNHVLESENDAAGSEVEFDFELDLAGNIRQSVTFGLSPQTFFLTDEDLDFTLVAVTPKPDREPIEWGWIHFVDQDGLLVKGEYVSIIQHPNGEAKQLALRENEVIDLLDNFAHYKTDTAPGRPARPSSTTSGNWLRCTIPECRTGTTMATSWRSTGGSGRSGWATTGSSGSPTKGSPAGRSSTSSSGPAI